MECEELDGGDDMVDDRDTKQKLRDLSKELHKRRKLAKDASPTWPSSTKSARKMDSPKKAASIRKTAPKKATSLKKAVSIKTAGSTKKPV